MRISILPLAYLVLCIANTEAHPDLRPRHDKNHVKSAVSGREFWSPRHTIKERQANASSADLLQQRALVTPSTDRRKAIYVQLAAPEVEQSDPFRDGPARPPGTPTEVQLPPRMSGISAKLQPLASPTAASMRMRSGALELGNLGINQVGITTARPVRVCNMNGQGAIFLLGKTRVTDERPRTQRFISAARYNLGESRSVNRAIRKALDIGRVSTLVVVVPYIDEDTDSAREYARSVVDAMLVVFPGVKVAPLMAYPYTPVTRLTRLARAWDVEAPLDGYSPLTAAGRDISRKDFPKKGGWFRTRFRAFRGWCGWFCTTAMDSNI